MGIPPKQYIRTFDSSKWMKKRKFNELRRERDQEHRLADENNRLNVEFAKNLFVSWDDDGSGVLEAQEIIKPLISLGLAPNSDFALRLLQAVDPASKSKPLADLKITLQDFIRIFRSSKVSDSLVNIIHNETEKRLK